MPITPDVIKIFVNLYIELNKPVGLRNKDKALNQQELLNLSNQNIDNFIMNEESVKNSVLTIDNPKLKYTSNEEYNIKKVLHILSQITNMLLQNKLF